ncbi:MAG: Ig-like domain-containing protein [Acidimicrobiales bacterium]|jgi:hypothetical protein
MVGERRRRGRRPALARRLIRLGIPAVVAVVVVVLAASAVAQIGPQSGPYRRSVDRGYVALARPLVAMSNASGQTLESLLHSAATLDRVTLFGRLDALVADTAGEERLYRAITPPDPSTSTATRCSAAVASRARAVAALRGALEGVLGGRNGLGSVDLAGAITTVASAGTTLHGADRSWAACRRGVERAAGSARLPASVWLADPGSLSAADAARVVGALAGSRALAPVHRLAILAVVTDPPAVMSGGTGAVVPTISLGTEVVVANQGNVDEDGVEVGGVAQLLGEAASPAPVQRTVSLAAGASTTLALPAFSVRPGSSYTLQITAETPRPGGTGPLASDSIEVQVQPAATVVSVLSSSSRVASGASLTLTAEVTPSLTDVGQPDGTVAFEVDGAAVPACTARGVSDGKATCTTTLTAAGAAALSAVYSGSPRFAGATSPAITVVVTSG